VGFVVDKVALRQVFPVNLHSTNYSTITLTYHLGLGQEARSGRSTRDLSDPTSNKKKYVL
jgi:hypothetical protein